MARDSFNEQKNKNVYSTKKKSNKKDKKKTTKTVVKKPQSSSVSKETTQEQRINQKTYGQPTKPAYKNNKAKTSQKQQTVENNTRVASTIQRGRTKVADTSREMMSQRQTNTNTSRTSTKPSYNNNKPKTGVETALQQKRDPLGINNKQTVQERYSKNNPATAKEMLAKDTQDEKYRDIGERAAKQQEERFKKTETDKTVGEYTEGVLKRKALGYAKTASKLVQTNEGYKASGRWAQEDPEFARHISSKEFSARADKAFDDYAEKQEETQKKLTDIENRTSGAGKIALQAYGSGLEMGVDRLAGPLWAVSMFASAYGNQRGQAMKEGATDEQDAKAAFFNAGVEVATEYMFKPVAGIASKFGGKHSLDFAGKLASKVTSKLTGNKAKIADIAVRTLGSQVEEGLEEAAGWFVSPYVNNAVYKNDLQNKREADAHAEYNDMQQSFWNQFDSEEEAQQAALHVNSNEFINELSETYESGGATKEEARNMAQLMQKYFLAHFDNDEEAAAEAEAEMDKFVVGDVREKHDWKELGQTLASTFLLTGVTGGASVYYTNQIGEQMLNETNGKNKVKQYTDIVIKYDPDNAKDAKYVKDTIDNGGVPTGTQTYQVASHATEVLQDMSKREMASDQVKQRGMRDEGLKVSPVIQTRRGIQFNEETGKAYQASYDKAMGVIRGVRKHGSDVGLSNETLTSEETMKTAAHAVAAYETGTITAEQINDLTIDNPEVRTIFELATKVDLSQYNVTKKGKIDEVASNNAMMTGLLANSADNYLKMARAEQKQWNNKTRGQVHKAMTSNFGEMGNLVMHSVLKTADPRDTQHYMLTARIAQNVYDYARRTDIEWDKMKQAYSKSFKSVDMDVMKNVYDAAKWDKQKAETPYLGKRVITGESMRFEKTDNGVEQIFGEFTNDSARELTGEEDEAMRAVASQLGVNIRIVPNSELAISDETSEKKMSADEDVPHYNGTYDPDTNTIYLAETNGLNDNILYAMSHETTHLLAQYAPEEYMKLSNYIMDRYYRNSPGRYEAAIKAKQDLYKRVANQDLSEEAALEEIIADATRDFWADPEFVNQISNDIKEPGFFKGIVNAIRDMLRHIRNLLSSGHFDGTEHEDVLWDLVGTYSKAEKLWLKAYKEAARNRAQQAIADWQENVNADKTKAKPFYLSHNEMNENLHKVHNMEPIGTVAFNTSLPISKSAAQNAQTAYEYLENNGFLGTYREDVGKIDITKGGLSDVFSHKMEKLKMSSLGAIPYVLESGHIVAADLNHEGRGYNTVTIVAPVNYTNNGYGKFDIPGDYYTAVVLKRNYSRGSFIEQSLHVTDVLTYKKDSLDSGAISETETHSNAENLSLRKILEHVDANVNIFEPSDEKIRYSIPTYTQEEMDAHRQALIEDAEESYGEAWTEHYSESGYVFPNGKMLKMGAYGQRGEDHAMAGLAYDDVGYDTYFSPKSEAQKRFINEGNIRWMPENGWLNLGTNIEPTPEQYDWIEDAVYDFGINRIEFTDTDDNTADYKDYSDYAEADEIINDIKRFYRDGKIGGSQLSQFRYSISEVPSMEELDQTNSIVEDDHGDAVAQFDENGSARFSISSYESEGRKIYKDYLDKLVNDKELSQEEADQMLRELETIYDISKRFADQTDENGDPVYAPYTAWSYADVIRDEKGKPVFSAIKKNSEYKMNIDFSTICKKRRTLDAVFREMIKRGLFEQLDLNKDESAALVVNINNLIRKNKFEAACALCFVEARRYRQQQTAKTFTNMWNGLVESMYEDKSKIGYFNFGRDDNAAEVPDGIHTMDDSQLDLSYITKIANEKKDGKLKQTAEAKAARLILNDPNQRKLMRVGDMMASTGFENMQIENPELMKVYNSKKGTGGAKSSFGDVQYLNEMIRSKAFDRMKAYDVSGVRIQSFSDYVPRMVFDYVQVIADLAAKKLPAHAYTKEPLFVKQFGLSGVKINLSLVPDVVTDGIAPGLDANGDYIWNVEGTFPYDEAMKIQEAEGYKDNCGTIAVGISDEQIMKMLADPTIQMVIPYHKSSLNPIVAAMTNVDRFTNYEDFQNTKDAEGKAVKKDFPWDKKLFALTHYTRGENKGELKPKEKWGNVQDLVKEYVDWCEEKNYTPKFSQFLYMEDGSINPGYYKLLEDFALLDNDGNFKPQGDVQMKFPTEESEFGSMEELIKQGLSEDTELEADRSAKIGGIVDEIENMMTEGTLTEQSVASQKLAQKFSITESFEDQVDGALSGTLDKHNAVYVGETTDILHQVGLNELPMLMTQKHVRDINKSKSKGGHGLSKQIIKEIPNQLKHPAMIMDSLSTASNQGVVVVTSLVDDDNVPVIIAIKPDGHGYYYTEMDSNFITSAYGKSGFENFIDRNVKEDTFLYISKEKSQLLEAQSQLQLLGKLQTFDFDKIIKQSKNVVNNPSRKKLKNSPGKKHSIPDDIQMQKHIEQSVEDINDIPLQDAVLEQNRQDHMAAAEAFEANITRTWSQRKLNLAKGTPLKNQLIGLMKQVRKDSGTDRQYKTETLDDTIKSVKNMYDYANKDNAQAFAKEAWNAAERIVDDIDYNDDLYEKYKEIKTFFEREKIAPPSEVWGDEAFDNFRRENDGKIRWATHALQDLQGDEIELEGAYHILHRDYPMFFTEEYSDNPIDQLMQMAAVLNNTDAYRDAYTSEEHAKLVEDIANNLCDIVSEGSEYRATIDELNVKAMKQRHEEALRKVREERNVITDAERRRANMWKQRYNDRIQSEKEERKEKADKREHLKSYGHIEKNYKKLCDWVLKPTKEKNVPEEFRKSLAEFLQALDLQTENSKKLEAKTGRVAQKTIKMRELKDRLNDLATRKGEDGTSVWEVDASIAFLLEKLSDKLDENGNSIDALDNEDIATIDVFMKLLIRNIQRYKKVRTESKTAELSDVGGRAVEFLKRKIERDGVYGKRQGLPGVFETINATALTPAYLFDRMGPLKEMYDVLRHNGFDTYIRNEKIIMDRMGEILGDYYKTNKKGELLPGSEAEKWRDDRSAQTIELSNGKSVTMSVAQIMSLYCLAKRGEQALGHMMVGGIVVAPLQTGSKIQAAKEKLKGSKKNEISEKYVLAYEDVQNIISKLSADQRKVADQLQELMSVDMAKLGNEAHRELYGYEMFDEDNYFPIKVHGNERPTDVNNIGEVIEKIKSFGFTKPLTPKAGQAVEIDDIFSIVADHCNGMNLYNAYLVPITDFMKVLNYTHTFENGDVLTMKEAIEQAYGKDMLKYILNLMKDINGIKGENRGGLEGIMNAALGRAKRTAVFGNVRVALQQPTAIVRAAAEIDPKYIKGALHIDAAKGFVPTVETKSMEEMWKYCPIAQWKAWGYYDTYMGRDIEDVMMNKWSVGDKLLSGYYGQLDNATWSMIWQAVKAEQADKYPKMDHNSEEFLQICGRRASEVFDKTQVVDSTFHRSDAMRSHQVAVKLFTAFMAEPTLTLNVFRAGLFNAAEARKAGNKAEANKILGRAVSVIVVQAVFVSAAQAFADAWRGKDPGLPWDDDDDEEKIGYWWRWIHNFVYNMFDQAHLENNMYLVKDVTPYLNYMASQAAEHWNLNPTLRAVMGWDQDYLYSQNNLVFAGLENTANGIAQLFKKLEKGDEYVDYKTKEPKKWYDIIQKIMSGIGTFTGIPVGTLMRDFKPLIEKFLPAVYAADTELMDAVANKMGYQKAGSSTADNVASEKTSKESKGKIKAEGVSQSSAISDTDMSKLSSKAAEKAEGLSGRMRDEMLWDVVSDGYTKYIAAGDFASINKLRTAFEENGGDTKWFDDKITEACKKAYKKSIVNSEKNSDLIERLNMQEDIRNYMLEHGVSETELSDICYHSNTSKDLKAALRLGNSEYIIDELVPLVQAGLSYDDFVRLYDNRNRGAKEYSGKYTDPKYTKTTGTFVWPTQGTITSHFGYRNAPTRGASSNHPAIDIGAPKGTPVVAADGGVVIYAGTNGGYGNSVGIKHANGMVTYYNHLSAWNVKVGDQVGQGQQIANVGSTGISTGPHLDFKILDVDGNPVDPEQYLNKRS